MSSRLSCSRAQELFSDEIEGELHSLLAGELRVHLGECAECRELHAGVSEVIAALRATPVLEPAQDLAARAADAALRAGRRPPRSSSDAGPWRAPRALRLAAAATLVALGAGLLLAGPAAAPARAAERFAERSAGVAAYLTERRDRAIAGVRALRVVLSAALEGRVDRLSDRIDDYKRLLDERRAGDARETPRPKEVNPAAPGSVGRVEPGAEDSRALEGA
ncbi:MAG: hypothetical protein AB7O37_21355 [Vicinamibacteria bacterium]